MLETREVWQKAFDEELERSGDSFLASKVADDTVEDLFAAAVDEAYDHWRDLEA
jgi:hypothetical protein